MNATAVDARRTEARYYMTVSAPRSPEAHLIESALGRHLFIADGSRLFDADPSLFAQFDAAMTEGRVGDLLDHIGLGGTPLIDDTPLSSPPMHGLSLAIAQKCNLGCSYCYAQQGEFGGTAKNMPAQTAHEAVDLLIAGAAPGARLNLAFLGGEPLVNRSVLQSATRRAAELADRRGLKLTFSITTNGTLLSTADADFFEAFGFAVTVSLDGPREVHDTLRMYKDGHGSFDHIMQNVQPLLSRQRRMQVSARVTITPKNLSLRAYMSPEQVRAKDLDSRTDLFSLGTMLYQMATGALPFRGESTGVIFHAILERPPASAARLNPDLPVELERIINKCLEKNRNLRYQHAADVRTDLQRLKRDTESTRIVIPEGRDWVLKPRKIGVVLIACIAAIGLAAVGAWYLRSGSTSQINSIAVLPFINGGGDANTDYLSDGITESLIDNLAHVPQLKVKSRNSVFHYKGKDVDMQKAGNELGVSALVTGRVVPRGDGIEVSAELTDVRDSTEIWGQHYSGKSADIISLQQQIAGDIAEKLRSKLSTSEKQQVTKQGTQNPEAYELYLKGRYSWNKRTSADLAAAISYFNQAIAKDPGYALAFVGLADAYTVLPSYGGSPSEDFPKSNAAARKALELDATLSRPHAVLGSNEFEYDWDFAGGETEYKKALDLDPNDATLHDWYACDIGMVGGREQDALAEINRAHRLDPLSPVFSTYVGIVHVFARQYDEAITTCKKVADEDPTFALAHSCLAQAYWGKRMYPQVIEEWKIYGKIADDQNESEFAAALAQGFRSAGWKGALTKGIEIRQAQRKTGYSSAATIGSLYADLGDKDQALQWLNTAYQERDYWLVGLRTNFLFDPIRSDPRFVEIVHRVGLPQ